MSNKKNDLKVVWTPIGRLRPYEKNPRTHPPGQIEQIARLITTIGWTNPILTDGANGILAGHGRLEAAKRLGIRSVPVISLRGLTATQKRMYIIADNKAAADAGWDKALLAAEFADLSKLGADLTLTGFDASAIEQLLAPSPGPGDEPGTPARPKNPVTKAGDIWVLGEHRMMCGDSTKPAAMRALLDGAVAQCVFTDPPYGVSYEARGGEFDILQGDDLRRGQLTTMLSGAFQAAVEHVAHDAGWYVWHASSTREDFAKAMRDAGLVELGTIIWAKPGMVLGWSDYRWSHEPCFYAARQGVRPAFYGDGTDTTVWRAAARAPDGSPHSTIGTGITLVAGGSEIYVMSAAPKGKKVRHAHVEAGKSVLLSAATPADDLWEVSRDSGHGKGGSIHPTQKPVELARRAVRNSTREGEAVLDMFAGSGSTIIACEQLGRRGHAMELDPSFVDAAVLRWQEATGKKATHASEKKTFDALAKARTGRKARAR